MCWESKKPVKKVADKDVHVFKICRMRKGYALPYYMTAKAKYVLGGTYDADWFEEPNYSNGAFVINHGMHSFSCECSISHSISANIIKIRPFGLKERIVLDWYDRAIGLCMMLCTIPKGEPYYVNEYGECVSRRIRVDAFVEIENNISTRTLNTKLEIWNKK